MNTMKLGFMDFVRAILIPEFPGQTANWYAEKFLDEKGQISESKTPKQSLANTLRKQVQLDWEPTIRREQIKGIYHYFPVERNEIQQQTNLPKKSEEDLIVQLTLSNEILKDINNLVEVGKFKNRTDAIKWLIIEGIHVKRSYLDKVEQTRKEIERIKKELNQD